ncbi:MAG: ferritin-like domain-containing protein [Polyangiaceae bacterium]
MRSVLRVRQQILAGLGGGFVVAAGVACGGSTMPDPDGNSGSAGADSTTGPGGAGGASGSGATGGATTGGGGADMDASPDSAGTGGATTTGSGGSTGGTAGTGGATGGGGSTGSGGATGGTTTGGTTTGTGGATGSGGATGGTTTGSGGSVGTGGATTTGTGGATTTGGTTTGTGGTGTGGTTTGTGGATTGMTSGGTTTGTGGSTGGSGGGGTGGSTGGTGGTGPFDAGVCPPDAGSPEIICENNRVCLSAAALARYTKPTADGGVRCSLPAECPKVADLYPTGCWMQFGDRFPGNAPVDGLCCYQTWVDGRPFIVEGSERRAMVIESTDWNGANGADCAATGLTATQCALLADAWLDDATAEHASIATFARLTLQLLSLGAPPDLVAAAQRAAGDEIEHARLCFEMASRYARRPLGPGKLAVEGALANTTFAELAVAAIREGCWGETLAAVVAGERRDRARDPRAVEILTRITDDETRHAELAWRTVVWAIERGGSRVYDAVRAEFDSIIARHGSPRSCDRDSELDEALCDHGLASSATLRRAEWTVVREIVVPIAAQLTNVVREKLRPTSATVALTSS